ncbi:hypothetical protein WJG10_004998, partial [Klebsiella aerogenes]
PPEKILRKCGHQKNSLSSDKESVLNGATNLQPVSETGCRFAASITLCRYFACTVLAGGGDW